MTVTILDAQDAILGGRAQAEEAFREFQQTWNAPLMKMQLKAMWAAMPEAQKELLKRSNPEMFAKAQAYLESAS